MISKIIIQYAPVLNIPDEIVTPSCAYWKDLEAFVYDNTHGLVVGQDFTMEFEFEDESNERHLQAMGEHYE